MAKRCGRSWNMLKSLWSVAIADQVPDFGMRIHAIFALSAGLALFLNNPPFLKNGLPVPWARSFSDCLENAISAQLGKAMRWGCGNKKK